MREYRASSLGYSLCQLVAPHLGYEPLPAPDYLQDAYDEGNRIEPLAVAKLRENLPCQIDYRPGDGSEVDGRKGEEVRLEIIPGVAVVVAHLDGRISISSNGGEKVLEIKSMSEKRWEDFYKNGFDSKDKLLEKYKWQMSAMMLATGLPCMMVAWNKGADEDAPFEKLIARQTVVEPFYGISDIARKLYAAEGYINRGEIPEGCSDFPCPYVFLHAPKEEVEKADKELDYLLEAWLLADRAEKASKKDKDHLRAAIVEYVGEEGAGKVKGSQGVTVSTVWQPGKKVSYKTKDAWVTSVSAPRKRETKDE